ncbi:MAG TPA: NHL repeat-containing protein [Candidatus Baltobacteraceae bacterium]|nr:NHL repeat-containing protein [Candidatus Baltobacteraceae bacterium]
MKDISHRIRFALGVAAGVILVGCGSGIAPISNPSGIPTLLESGRSNARAEYKLYVVSLFSNGETFTPKGKQTHPRFNSKLASGVAVDKHGKIYVTIEAPNGDGFLITFLPNGARTTPTIDNLYRPVGVAVDANGKIYIASDHTVSTYTPGGKPAKPTIAGSARGVAVDKNGKIYVASNDIRTYTPQGKPTKPTIADGGPDVAVDKNGKIYVAGGLSNSVRTYTPNGKRTTPTITAGLNNPISVAIDPNGKIFVVSFGTYLSGPWSVTSYKPNGEQTTPTITNGLTDPVSVAIR